MKKYINLEDKIRFVLIHFWDPIDIKANPNLYDEYDFYIGDLKKMIINNVSIEEFYSFLKNIEINDLGYNSIDEEKLKIVSLRLKKLCQM